jgi:lipoyl(octanoyl) transferase
MIIAAKTKKVCDRSVLAQLTLWNDAQPHDGPTNMAIDDWLWHHATVPTLRVYRWQGEWISIGYFTESNQVPVHRPFVRRPTGGGVVDHREDWTYTLVVPRGEVLAEMPGAESYRAIHRALRELLTQENVCCELVSETVSGGDGFCFQSPVLHDLVDAEGRKLAGAGQRRGRQGLLHQGSLQVRGNVLGDRADHFSSLLAETVAAAIVVPDAAWIQDRCEKVYGNSRWNRKR